MDLVLDDEQVLLVEAARGFLARRAGPSVSRRVERSPSGDDADLWAEMSDLGWPALVGDDDAPSDGGMLELALVARELGRGACSTPLLAHVCLVTLPVRWASPGRGVRRWLPELLSGRAVGVAALFGDQGRDEWSALSEQNALVGVPTAGGWALSGRRTLVPFAHSADLVLVPAVLEGRGPALVLLPAAGTVGQRRRLAVLGADPLFSLSVEGAVTEDDIVAEGRAAVEVLQRALDHAAVVSTAYAAGLGARALELSVEHARDREQFGRPIGSFQAIAHRCAEMRAELDAVELLAFQAAWALDHEEDPGLAVSAAKGYATEALRRIFLHAHQVLGAMGFTMEHDLQLFTRRAKAFELTLGGVDRHRERVAEAMGL